ncbi:hypothetical protein ACWPKO_28615 (plasmid) [Coraliomargarita sp. W4R53]
MSSGNRELSAPEIAVRISVSHGHATQLLRSGAIAGRQLRSGAWLASPESVARYEASARQGRGRAMNVATAWGLLWELSDLKATWLTSSTLSRIRAQIANSTAEEIARAVTARTIAHYYSSAGHATSTGLILTGRSVAGSLPKSGMKNRQELITGYVLEGSVNAHASRFHMNPADDGHHVLFENTLPIPYDRARMPPAVIAADLARSSNQRERQRAVMVLHHMQQRWLSAH